ncbi:MAG: hypothetical protein C4321_03015 [Chloroflexota bacterium]
MKTVKKKFGEEHFLRKFSRFVFVIGTVSGQWRFVTQAAPFALEFEEPNWFLNGENWFLNGETDLPVPF